MKHRCILSLLALAAVLLPACTVMRSVELVPQSHFVPPNSNVTPIGTVTGQASSSGFGFNPDMGSDIVARAYRDALEKKRGDLLIDVVVRRKGTSFLILPIVSTTVTVTGTAARVEAGKQQLTEMIDRQVAELARTAPTEYTR
jgi:hypothetical protein